MQAQTCRQRARSPEGAFRGQQSPWAGGIRYLTARAVQQDANRLRYKEGKPGELFAVMAGRKGV